MPNACRVFLTARRGRLKAFAPRTRSQVPEGFGQKKARPGSRADKVWRSFSVNEKVCFGKQRRQYNDAARIHYPQKQQTSVSNISTIAFPEVSRCFLAAIRVAHAQRHLVDTASLTTLFADKPLYIKKNTRSVDHCRIHNDLLWKLERLAL
ncbi:hypothetical protein [Caballeronia sp. AZ7_KS35]|uniref:hypothetical protein n=1 Tax=Caballeronia sp. AZ7_KS35 TaxID=2921762 RepID=UPI0020289D53|nr:hypothetical protein [Caballeronia sp. AZ7_KS35]